MTPEEMFPSLMGDADACDPLLAVRTAAIWGGRGYGAGGLNRRLEEFLPSLSLTTIPPRVRPPESWYRCCWGRRRAENRVRSTS